VGQNVTIDAAVGSSDISQTHKVSQAGVNVGIGGNAAQAANAAYHGAQRGSQVQDTRLQALYAVQSYYQASDAMNAAQGGASQNGVDGGINLQIGIGGSSASSQSTSHDETTYGSAIRSNGNVTIAATNGDLNIIGSQVAGQDVTLAATNNLNLQSQAENHALQSNNKNISGGVGLQIGTDGIGIYAQAAGGQSHAHGNGITHTDTSVNADGTLTLISGNDTTIKGAQLTGNQVIAAIGSNLLIQSEQDTDDYASKQWQAGGKVVIGLGGGGGGGLNYNQSKVSSHYASVTNISGIQAGDDGFDITVGGNTSLIGGVIASTADPSKNILDTGSLTYASIHNEANYSASSIGISGSYSSGGMEFGRDAGLGGMPMLGVPQKGSSSSDTNSGIAQGTIIVHDGDADLSGLDRNPTLGNQALAPIFDVQKVQENIEAGQIAGYLGMRAAGDLAGQMGWAEGSPERTILHGVVGAGIAALGGGDIAQGAMGAAANQLVIQQMADYLESQGYKPGTPEFGSMLKLASTAVGAAVGGGAGAATALDGTTYNYLTHQQKDALRSALKSCASQNECQKVVDDYAELSQQNDAALQQTCAVAPQSASCQDGVREALSYANALALPGTAGDVNQSRNNVLNLVMTNSPAYGAINTIDARADFFGAMFQLTGAPWFGAAAQTSIDDLMGPVFSAGNFITSGGMADWRNQAGSLIMQNGESSFINVYQNYQNPGFDLNVWSLNQLTNEQNALQPIYEQQNGWTKAILFFGGEVKYLTNPLDANGRIQFGCIRMSGDGYQGACQ
jgi:filamentous hemagglutinin